MLLRQPRHIEYRKDRKRLPMSSSLFGTPLATESGLGFRPTRHRTPRESPPKAPSGGPAASPSGAEEIPRKRPAGRSYQRRFARGRSSWGFQAFPRILSISASTSMGG